MATTQNTYTGNGSTTNFSFTFEYLSQADVKASINGVTTTAFTFPNATTLSFTSAPASGSAIRIFRDTDITTLNAIFFPGSAIKAEDLNDNFTQTHFATQETDNEVVSANTTADSAKSTADSAVSTANNAVTTANTASTNASAAVTTANTASSTATTAVNTANSAVTTANTANTTAGSAVTTAGNAAATANAATTTANNAVTTANAATTTANSASTDATAAVSTANTASTTASNAVTTANSAVSTANTANTTAASAVTTANSAVSTANTASTNATAAVNTANAASVAVTNAVLFTLIANVAAIPGSPANNDYIEIANSTGIQSFTPVSGLPTGFVGDTGLTVRLRYDSSATSWVFINYFAIDSETRYAPIDAPAFTGNVGVGLTNPNTLLHVHAPAGNPAYFHSSNASSGGNANDGVVIGLGNAQDVYYWNYENGNHIWATNAIERMRIDSSGRVGVGVTPANYGTGANAVEIHSSGSVNSFLSLTNTTSGTGGSVNGFNIIASGTEARLFNREAGDMSFWTAATERMRIDSSGRLLIGTTTATAGRNITMSASTDAGIQISGGSAGSNVYITNTPGSSAATYIGNTNTRNLNFVVGGNVSTKMAIASSGNVGIGTSDPDDVGNFTKALDISGSSGASVVLRNNNSSTNCGLVAYYGTATYLMNRAAGPVLFYTSNTERMRIDSSGNLGIGTSSPNSYGNYTTLTLNGTHGGVIDFETGGVIKGQVYSTPNDFYIQSIGAIPIKFFANSGLAMEIYTDRGVNLKKYIEFTDGSDTGYAGYLGSANILLSSGEDEDFVVRAEQHLIFASNGASERMRINNTGKVGINTSSPAATFSVDALAGASTVCFLKSPTSASYLQLGNSANDQGYLGYQSSDMTFHTAAGERMRLDSSGKLMLGTTTPGFASYGDRFTISTSSHCGMTLRGGETSDCEIFFADGTGGTSRYRGGIRYSHNTDHMQFTVNATEKLRIQPNGGISFNGDTATANALDDYEEGYWTPQINSGISVSSYSMLAGKYTKIGNLVTADFYITFNVSSTTGASIVIGGLPYNISNDSYGSPSVDYVRGLGHSSWQNIGTGLLHFYGSANTNTFGTYKDGGTTFTISSGTSLAGKYLIGSYHYHTS